jgi:hypothetical protein
MSKYRPNYIKARQHIQQAAEALATAGDVLFRAYQKGIPEGHPLLVAMRALADLDRDTAKRASLEPQLEVTEMPAGADPPPSLLEKIYSLSTDLWYALTPSTEDGHPGVPGPVGPEDPDYNPDEAALWGACEQLKEVLTWAEAIHARGAHLPPVDNESGRTANCWPGPMPPTSVDPPYFPSEYQQEPPPPYQAPLYPHDVTAPGPDQQPGSVPSKSTDKPLFFGHF